MGLNLLIQIKLCINWSANFLFSPFHACKQFIWAFLILQTIFFKIFRPPPPPKNNGPSLRAGCPKMPGRTIEIRSFKNYSKIGFVHDLMSIAA